MLKTIKRYGCKVCVPLGTLAIVALVPRLVKAGPPAAPPSPANADSAKPNVLVVVMDDVGYSDIGAYGGEIKTPNIDSLARDGLRYLRFDTNAVCSATRASLLTARNDDTVKMEGLAAGPGPVPGAQPLARGGAPFGAPARGARGGARGALGARGRGGAVTAQPGFRDPKDQSPRSGWMPLNAETVAQALKMDGYTTWALGKWHLAPQFEDGSPGHNADFPLQRGFDYFYGYRDGWTDQYRPILYEDNHSIPIPNYPYGDLLAWDLANHAISQMKTHEAKDPKQPFFMYLAFTQAHTPYQVPQSYIQQYDGVYDKGWDAIRAARFQREKVLGVIPQNAVLSPRNPGDPAWDTLTPTQKKVYAQFMQTYAGYLQYGDQQLGRVLGYLHGTGLDKNTLIVLLSDNGPASESKGGGFYNPYGASTSVAEMESHLNELGGPETEPLYQRAWAMAGATPFRRYKLWPYLGGVRDDMIVSWPGHVQDPGSTRDQYTHVIDIAPTILAAAGTHFAPTIAGVKQIPVAGKSFLDSFESPKAPPSRTIQYFLLWGNRAITDGNWRAVAMHKPGTPFTQDRWQLFNLTTDPTEVTDLAPTDPEKLAQMKALWQSQAKLVGALPLEEAGGRSRGYADAFPPTGPYNY